MKRDPKDYIVQITKHATVLEAPDLLEAWKIINEFLLTQEKTIGKAQGKCVYGGQVISYNNLIHIAKATVDPEFDLGLTLGYKDKKWTTLVRNYVDMNYLDLIRRELNGENGRKSFNCYNYSFHFSNRYGSGKDCLVSLIFAKRINMEIPTVYFTIRTSEVTKRLLFDLILVQRCIEYVYGKDAEAEVIMVAPSMYITAESILMYNNVKPIKKLLKPYRDDLGPFQKKVLKAQKKFSDPEEYKKMTFHVNMRISAQIIRDKDGHFPYGNNVSMKAKELQLQQKDLQLFPKGVISKSQQNQYLKAIGKK